MTQYDYIIVGAGAAGLLLADAMGTDAFFSYKSILILEKEPKNQNDRTWCFWEKGEGQFDFLMHQSWDQILVAGENLELRTSIAPYTYKMIRGADFYQHFVSKVKANPNITWNQENVVDIRKEDSRVIITTEHFTYVGECVFSSLYDKDVVAQQMKYPLLQQHFLGWTIKTDHSVFKTNTATFMDFSIPQNGNTRFMYVLPFSETEALVEYTLFSEHLLEKEAYEDAIKNYIEEKFPGTIYTIQEKEFGTIPMTCYPFHHKNTERIFHIGIAGGWAKPSTGFTFFNTSKQIIKLVEHLKMGKPLSKFHQKNRFGFYDMLLLDILYKNNHLGASIFTSLFKKRKASLILKFLGNETNLWEELQIVTAPKPMPFIKALVNRIF
ncbi:lycopene cyclase family protein [Flagellimonas pelagia]|uniref:Lycopene cyclase n=1 Tax=Flagellimonas pelagia TaxID=2306998 RepID=A0A3A1NPA7_9FLAO|nr:lycopene cyclase family protein [Allomuricauda maritima]RIV46251.1 lycopene cyclase [Allomuricauda maritima]TXJ98950.1 lycopene cyclase [Allomuricauda maritima]